MKVSWEIVQTLFQTFLDIKITFMSLMYNLMQVHFIYFIWSAGETYIFALWVNKFKENVIHYFRLPRNNCPWPNKIQILRLQKDYFNETSVLRFLNVKQSHEQKGDDRICSIFRGNYVTFLKLTSLLKKGSSVQLNQFPYKFPKTKNNRSLVLLPLLYTIT